ncbi:MAG: hypothetical protein P3X24_004970 [bacterium]|nr:hypothetical protein [bacterium]
MDSLVQALSSARRRRYARGLDCRVQAGSSAGTPTLRFARTGMSVLR